MSINEAAKLSVKIGERRGEPFDLGKAAVLMYFDMKLSSPFFYILDVFRIRDLWLTEFTVCFIVRDDGTTRSTHKKPKEDTFGQNDDDWMVYRSIVSEWCNVKYWVLLTRGFSCCLMLCGVVSYAHCTSITTPVLSIFFCNLIFNSTNSIFNFSIL